MIEAAIFDMDGVLIDSVPSAYRAKTRVLKENYGIDITSVPDPHLEEHKGGSIKTLLKAVRDNTKIEIDDNEFIDSIVTEFNRDLIASNITVNAELLTFLHDLKAHSIPLAVATAGTKISTANKLRILGLTDFFDYVITSDDVTEHKPNPAVYLLAAQRLGIESAKSIVFEDSAAGVAAGLAAKANVVGVTIYNSDKKAYPGTIIMIDNWADLTYTMLEILIR